MIQGAMVPGAMIQGAMAPAGLPSGVIVIAPPWPRSGSSNIFAAQVAAHARRGARVFLMLAPLGRGFSRFKQAVWQDIMEAMRFTGVETVAYPRVGRRRVRAYLDWLQAGRDDLLAITARYAAAGRLPDELDAFLSSARIDLIHANHVMSIPLAQRIAGLVLRRQQVHAHILLDTHDIQSEVFEKRQKKNPFSGRRDAQDDLLRTELALCAEADTLVHITEADGDFFSTRLPGKRHTVVLPTLHPESEAELIRRRSMSAPAEQRHFVYIGNSHEANLETVRWLLQQVLPLASPDVAARVRIVGAVGDMLRRRDPDLYRAHAPLFVGEIPSVLDFYGKAQAILAPATAGTGSSIKLIEALCAGTPILTTSLALRGLPAGARASPQILVHDTAAAFARAFDALVQNGETPGDFSPNAAIYDRVFSNARYFSALDELVRGSAVHRPAMNSRQVA